MKITLTFHGIGPAPAHVPAEERPYWIGEAGFEDYVAQAVASREQGVEVTFSFDDGNPSDLAIAAPLLERHGLRGLFFPCAGRLGDQRYLDAGDLRALGGMGFTVGSHGADHVPWRKLDAAALEREAVWSRQALSEAVGHDVDLLALPFGSYDRRVLAAARDAGYRTVYSSDPGADDDSVFLRRRFTIRADHPPIKALVARCRDPRARLTVGIKGVFKALRY